MKLTQILNEIKLVRNRLKARVKHKSLSTALLEISFLNEKINGFFNKKTGKVTIEFGNEYKWKDFITFLKQNGISYNEKGGDDGDLEDGDGYWCIVPIAYFNIQDNLHETNPTIAPPKPKIKPTPIRRPLTPPKPAPQTKPKAESLKENEKDLLKKVEDRFKDLKK